MRNHLNIDLVFPIRDDVSAWLMCVKAELLYDAGVVSLKDLNTVIGRAATITDQPKDWWLGEFKGSRANPLIG